MEKFTFHKKNYEDDLRQAEGQVTSVNGHALGRFLPLSVKLNAAMSRFPE